jgi:hypothetical protein
MAKRSLKLNVDTWFEKTIYFIIFVLLGILTYMLLVPKSRESFETSRSLYPKSKDFDKDFVSSLSTLTDNDDMLLMQGCYQFDPKNATRSIPNDCYTVRFQLYTTTFETVRAKIIEQFMIFKDKIKQNSSSSGDRIEGDVYALIEQSPYYRDNNNNVIAIQYNISSYLSEPVNVMKTNTSANVFNQPIYIRVTLYFTRYGFNGLLRASNVPPLDVKSYLRPFRTNKEQCYIACPKDVTDSYCGCLNRTTKTDPQDNQFYASSCVSTSLSTNGTANLNKAVNADFGILYIVNPKSSALHSYNLFNI